MNRQFDRLIRPEFHLAGHRFPAYLICGIIGYLAAAVFVCILTGAAGLSVPVMLGLSIISALSFFALAMAGKILSGNETHIYYHHQIFQILTAIVFLRLFGRPVLPYLDITILGLGVFLFFGRIGCLMAGCCHGHPSPGCGVKYGDDHVLQGFEPYLKDRRLFPIQGVEALLVALLIAFGAIVILSGRPSGEAFCYYILLYGVVRFFIEFKRGDAARPYAWGYSEAQWTSIALAGLLALLQGIDLLPFNTLQLGIALMAPSAMLIIALRRRFREAPLHRLLHPRHLREMVQLLSDILTEINAADTAAPDRSPDRSPDYSPALESTSCGLRISGGRMADKHGPLIHYAISLEKGGLCEKTAGLLAEKIRLLCHPSAKLEVLPGMSAIFHVLIRM